MRVLLEPSSYHLQNAGDNAMLRVCASRISTRWPEAELHVATESPDRLKGVVPAAIAATRYVDLRDRVVGVGAPTARRQPSRFNRLLKRRVHRRASALFAERLHRADCRRVERDARFPILASQVSEFDLVVGTGGGYLTDCHRKQAQRVLWTLRVAQMQGIPTALFGQGIGPLDRGPLECLAAEVVARADLIGLREAQRGTDWLQRWGIDQSRVVATGDDAIELACCADAVPSGSRIGLNVRICNYAGFRAEDAQRVARVVGAFAARMDSTIEPIVVTTNTGEADDAALNGIGATSIPGCQGCDDGGLIDSIATCRVIVTGSYHAAVFALAQGIPAIGIVASDYYLHKFTGLAEFFGGGCALFRAHRESDDALDAMVASHWENAPNLRDKLRRSAARQVELSKSLYDRLKEVMLGRTYRPLRECSSCA
jgi:polysaccharide pyruvyl transferase WcaK-like protein